MQAIEHVVEAAVAQQAHGSVVHRGHGGTVLPAALWLVRPAAAIDVAGVLEAGGGRVVGLAGERIAEQQIPEVKPRLGKPLVQPALLW